MLYGETSAIRSLNTVNCNFQLYHIVTSVRNYPMTSVLYYVQYDCSQMHEFGTIFLRLIIAIPYNVRYIKSNDKDVVLSNDVRTLLNDVRTLLNDVRTLSNDDRTSPVVLHADFKRRKFASFAMTESEVRFRVTDLAGRSVDVGVVAAHRPAVRSHHISLHHMRSSARAEVTRVAGHPVLVGKGAALSVHDTGSA